AVAVTIASAAFPMAGVIGPAAVSLGPVIGDPAMAVTLTQPVAGDPHVAAVAPGPVARCPDVAATRPWHDFRARRRRSFPDDDRALCVGSQRHAGKRAGDQGGEKNFPEHLCLPRDG